MLSTPRLREPVLENEEVEEEEEEEADEGMWSCTRHECLLSCSDYVLDFSTSSWFVKKKEVQVAFLESRDGHLKPEVQLIRKPHELSGDIHRKKIWKRGQDISAKLNMCYDWNMRVLPTSSRGGWLNSFASSYA